MSDADAHANRGYWDAYADEYQDEHHALLARPRVWGTFGWPDDELGVVGDAAGLDVLELGCGAGQWCRALAAGGARTMVGLDQSAGQLAHAGPRAAYVLADAGRIPVRGGAFDLVLSDHGAMGYVDPARTLPEIARVLRPGGRLAFTVFTALFALCWDGEAGRSTTRMLRSHDELGRWADETGFVSWDLDEGAWIRAFRGHGFTVEALIPLVAAPDATSSHHDAATTAWARRWPLEQLWVARRDPVRATTARQE